MKDNVEIENQFVSFLDGKKPDEEIHSKSDAGSWEKESSFIQQVAEREGKLGNCQI
jgi:hypothetical protein